MTTRPRKLPSGFWAKSSGPARRKAPARRRAPARGRRILYSTNFAQAVKSVVGRTEETKSLGTAVENGTIHNAAITNADLYPILAGMSVGPNSGQRIGDKIKPSSIRIKGVVSFYDRGQTVQAPMVVKIFALQWKGLKDGSSGFGSVPINTLMDAGGSVGAFDGSTLRALWSINKEAFQVLGSATLKISDTDVENHKAQTGHYEMTLKPPATFTYNTGSLYPSNYAPFLALGWFYEDGSTPAPTDVNIIHTSYATLYYKDA